MTTLVMKFGGASVGTTTALSQMLGIVLHEVGRWSRVLLVVSALDGVTDALIDATHLAQFGNERGYRRIAANLRARHLALAEGLALGKPELAELQADLDTLLFDLLNTFQRITQNNREALSPESVDAVVSVGERLAARIVAMLLRQHGLRAVAIDATDVMVTDAVFGSATPDIQATQAKVNSDLTPMLERGIVPVLTGFIGATTTGKPTTLGRGGSDYSASIFAVCTQAREVWVWSDVDGIMSADPHEVPEARTVAELSYAEMAELAYFGARILHTRMVAPLAEKGIPLRVKNIYKPQVTGTLIHAVAKTDGGVKSITQIQGIGLTSTRSGPLTEIVALVNEHLQRSIGTPSEVMIASQAAAHSFITSIIPTSAGPDAVNHLTASLMREISDSPAFAGWHVEPVSIVTAIGEGINGSPHITGQVIGSLQGIPLLGLSIGTDGCSVSVVVRASDSDVTVRQMHAGITR